MVESEHCSGQDARRAGIPTAPKAGDRPPQTGIPISTTRAQSGGPAGT